MLSGLIGAGAQEGLEELLVRQLKEQMAQEEIRQAKAREAQAAERFRFDQESQAADVAHRNRVFDRDEQRYQDETQQHTMDALRGQNEKMDARMTRLTKESELDDLVKTLEGMDLDPARRTAAVAAARAGRDINPDDIKTRAQLKEEADEAERREIRIRRASITPPREGPTGKVITEVGPDGKLRERWATGEELLRGVSVAEGDPNKVTEAEGQRKARVEGAMSFLDRLDGLRAKINTKMGPPQRLGGIVRRGVAMAGLDPDVSQYERERQAAGRALAVAIMGAQNLSDADAASWANLLPDSTVDSETASRLLATVRSTLMKMGGGNAGETKPKRLRFDANGNEIKE